MDSRLLLDTDVIVDYLRGREDAAAFLEARSETLLVSAVTVAELFAGVREGDERTALNAFLGAFEIVAIDRDIAEQGGLYRRKFGRSHGTGLADALIAASAAGRGASLATLNGKHFPMVADVVTPYRKG